MGALQPWHLLVIVVALVIFFGYKKLPDASRSLGRSLRIFKGEMRGMKEDDVRVKDPAATTPVRGEVVNATMQPSQADESAQLLEEARRAEARAAELRARAAQAQAGEQAGTAEGSR